jgi:hypothetical protein
VIDDQIVEGELHLLRLVPMAWLKPDEETRFEKVPTEFGPVTLKAKLDETGRRLLLRYNPEFRIQPSHVVLHIPPIEGMTEIILNGETLEWDEKRSALTIL